MPIYIPENDITLNTDTDTNQIDVTVATEETEIEIILDDDAQIYVQEAKYYSDRAVEHASYAEVYRTEAATSAQNASASETSAQTSATNASDSATLSRSWAVGDTNTRTGEETNNSKYYCQMSEAHAGTSQRYAEEAEDTIDTVRELTIKTSFTVNFLTGELEYVSPDITFLVNTTTGNLDWEVAA